MSEFTEKLAHHKSCHNCGMPNWAISGDGVETRLRQKPHNRFSRDTKPRVWCCSESCALQARAQAEMGSATHRWPMTLSEYAAQERTQRQRRSDRAKTTSEVIDSKEPKMGKNGFMTLPYLERQNALVSARKGGRPRKWETNAERMRAYRQKLK